MSFDPNAATMLANIASAMPNLMRMVTAIAYVLGMLIIMKGILAFKHYGETRSLYSRDRTMSEPLTYLVVGTALLYLPSTVLVGVSTFWTTPNPFGYVENQDAWLPFLNDCFTIIQFIGTISFIKGLITLNRLAEGSGQGVFSRGITHLVGGILCINIYQFIQVIMATLGISV